MSYLPYAGQLDARLPGPPPVGLTGRASGTGRPACTGPWGNPATSLVRSAHQARRSFLGLLFLGNHLWQQALRHDRRRVHPPDLVHRHRRGDRARRRGRSNLGPAMPVIAWSTPHRSSHGAATIIAAFARAGAPASSLPAHPLTRTSPASRHFPEFSARLGTCCRDVPVAARSGLCRRQAALRRMTRTSSASCALVQQTRRRRQLAQQFRGCTPRTRTRPRLSANFPRPPGARHFCPRSNTPGDKSADITGQAPSAGRGGSKKAKRPRSTSAAAGRGRALANQDHPVIICRVGSILRVFPVQTRRGSGDDPRSIAERRRARDTSRQPGPA